jgi:hypothetical protein
MLGVAGWIEGTGAILAIVLTSLTIVGLVANFFKKQIAHMIDDKLDPIYRRLDEHMSAEDKSLEKIAAAMADLARSWHQT